MCLYLNSPAFQTAPPLKPRVGAVQMGGGLREGGNSLRCQRQMAATDRRVAAPHLDKRHAAGVGAGLLAGNWGATTARSPPPSPQTCSQARTQRPPKVAPQNMFTEGSPASPRFCIPPLCASTPSVRHFCGAGRGRGPTPPPPPGTPGPRLACEGGGGGEGGRGRRSTGLGLGGTGGSRGARDGARGAPGGRRGGRRRLPQRGREPGRRGAHHGHCGRRPAGARGRAGGLRSRSSRGGRGRGPGSGAGAGPAPGAALGFWLRTRKGARARGEGKARAAPGCALRSPLPPPSCRRRRARRPFRTAAPPRPPPPAPAFARTGPAPASPGDPRPSQGRPPAPRRPGSPLAHTGHSWLDGHRYPARVWHTFPPQDGPRARTHGPASDTSHEPNRGWAADPGKTQGHARNTETRTEAPEHLSPRSPAHMPWLTPAGRHTRAL